MKKRQVIPFTLLLCAFLLWLYLKPEKVQPVQPLHQPNYIAYNLHNTHYDINGNITHKIFAEKTTSFVEKEITHFENPKLIVYSDYEKNNKPIVWQMSSLQGTLYKKNKLVLSNNVSVKNLTKDQLIQSMETTELTLLLDTKEITTESLVTWKGPQMQQQGIGMWASLSSEELIIKDQIKAVYLNESN